MNTISCKLIKNSEKNGGKYYKLELLNRTLPFYTVSNITKQKIIYLNFKFIAYMEQTVTDKHLLKFLFPTHFNLFLCKIF